jgi:hypothetical protein
LISRFLARVTPNPPLSSNKKSSFNIKTKYISIEKTKKQVELRRFALRTQSRTFGLIVPCGYWTTRAQCLTSCAGLAVHSSTAEFTARSRSAVPVRASILCPVQGGRCAEAKNPRNSSPPPDD